VSQNVDSMVLHSLQVFQHIILQGVPSEGIRLADRLRVFTAAGPKEQLIDNHFWWSAGEIDARAMQEAHTYAYSYMKFEPNLLITPEVAREFVRVFNAHVQLFCMALWLVKDNSPDVSMIHVRAGMGSDHIYAAKQSYISLFYTADCGQRETTFTSDEVQTALGYLKKIWHHLPLLDQNRESAVADAPRVTRALYFVQAARQQEDIAIKVAFYAICFETLFSTDFAGVAHRVSERAATFIALSGTDRQRVYLDVHHLYDARSTVVHGGKIGKKKMASPTLVEVATKCDEHLRRCIRRILDDDSVRQLFISESDDSIREHFLNELFPPAQAAPQEENQ
jgi:hypothetical protein